MSRRRHRASVRRVRGCGTVPGPAGERGSGSGLTLAVVAVLALVTTVVALTGTAVVRAGQLRSAADLVALAGARALLEGNDACPAADRTARLNASTLASCEVAGDELAFVVSVEVERPLGLRLPGAPEQLRAGAHAGSAELAANGAGR